jgi:Domain of unknown function (DUF5063)
VSSDAARRFCDLIDSIDGLTHRELLVELQQLLPDLIAAAGVVSPGDAAPGVSEVRARLVAKLGEHGYWQVADAWDYDDVIEGGLAEDLADIYGHLKGMVADPNWKTKADSAIDAVNWLIPSGR